MVAAEVSKQNSVDKLDLNKEEEGADEVPKKKTPKLGFRDRKVTPFPIYVAYRSLY